MVFVCQLLSQLAKISYQRVCERARGYQKGFVWEFIGLGGSTTIESIYAFDLSITHGDPRQHIWEFVCGLSDAANGDVLMEHRQVPALVHLLVMITIVNQELRYLLL